MPYVDSKDIVTNFCPRCEETAKELEEVQQEVYKLREVLDWGENLVVGFMLGEPPSIENVWDWLELTRKTLWPQPPKE